MATPITPPAGGFVVRTPGWDPVPTVPITPPSGGYVVRVGGESTYTSWHIGTHWGTNSTSTTGRSGRWSGPH